MKNKKLTIISVIAAIVVFAVAATALASAAAPAEIEAAPALEAEGAPDAVLTETDSELSEVALEVDLDTGKIMMDGKVVGTFDPDNSEFGEDGIVVSIAEDTPDGEMQVTLVDDIASLPDAEGAIVSYYVAEDVSE